MSELYLTLVVIADENASELHFRLKFKLKMKKLKEAYRKRFNLQVETLKFVYNDRIINDDDTPEMLDMKNGEIIDVYLEKEHLVLKVIDANDMSELHIKTNSLDLKLIKLKKLYIDVKGVNEVDLLKFIYDGHVLNDDDTPKSLEMKDQDVIKVYSNNQYFSQLIKEYNFYDLKH